MDEYIECLECGFVLLAGDGIDPEPRRVDHCPGCGAADFSFTGENGSKQVIER